MASRDNCSCGSEKTKVSKLCKKCEFLTRITKPHNKPLDVSGKVFNMWTALRRVTRAKMTTWICRCRCGQERPVQLSSLKNGLSKSCGCLNEATDPYTKRMRSIWIGMRSRCHNKKQPMYKYYGARGIKILWKNYKEFHDDMYESYKKHVVEFGEENTTIDRIDNNGNYELGNCRWATRSEQNLNRRGNSKCLYIPEWVDNFSRLCREHGVNRMTVKHRLKRGIPIEEALKDHPTPMALIN